MWADTKRDGRQPNIGVYINIYIRMVDIQSTTAEIRRGKKNKKEKKKEEEERRRKKPQDENIMACPITMSFYSAPQRSHCRRNARIASTVLATAIPSVCLSVCPFVLCQKDGT